MRTTEHETTGGRPWRTVLWIVLAGLIFGALGIGDVAEDILRSTRNSLHWNKASGETVLVRVDDKSLKALGRWPWQRSIHADVIERLNSAGAKRIFFDFEFNGFSDPVNDRRLAEAIAQAGNVVLPVRSKAFATGVRDGQESAPALLPAGAQAGSIGAAYNYQNAVWRLPFAKVHGGREIPSFAAMLANRHGPAGETFMIDYSIDPASVPAFSIVDIHDGRFDSRAISGKDIVIGQTSDTLGDMYFIPGTGRLGGAYVQLLGGETLKAGKPVSLGWLPPFAAAAGLSAIVLLRRRKHNQLALVAAAIVATLVGPVLLESRLIFLDIAPGLLVLAITAGILLRWRFNKRGLVDHISGLPNLTALKSQRGARDKALIAARVLNYAEVVAALPPNSERQLVEQIVTRLSVGARDRACFQGDGGIFAWFDDPAKPFGHHLEALHALFRTPVRVAGMSLDLSLSFGVEIGSGRSLANRLGSALMAAEEAAHDGLKWKYHDPNSLRDASWKLSMLSQLDEAVDRGEVWVAYQPKVDLKARRIVGAEALARWTHPEKGPIAAAEFVAAAEQHDRIGKLTAFVLDQAIVAAAALNRGGRDFEMSVNLSGRLLTDKGLVGRIAILLERHSLEPRHLTLELTETAALAGSGNALEMLSQLRELGVNISIDDYGTGLSTLEYLKKIPAGEIKIDQSFVRGMVENRSERLMVGSTIALAHSLGRRVVAEGVETRDALELLAELECDIVQGFITGRPMSLDSLKRRLTSDRSSKVA